MATAEVQHPVPTAVHDGSCFQEEEKHKQVTVKDDAPATEVEEAPDSEQVHANGVSKEDTKDQEEDSKENPKDHEVEATVAANASLMQDVAQEVEAKLGIVQDDIAAAADEEKPPKEEAEQRREVTKKAASKAVVVPVDDDDDLVEGEAAAPAEAVPETPEEVDGAAKEEASGEVLKEEKAHEEQ